MSAVIFAVVQEPGDWLFQPGELGSCFSNTRIAFPFARSVVFEEKEKKKNSKGQCDTVMAGNESTLSNLQFFIAWLVGTNRLC